MLPSLPSWKSLVLLATFGALLPACATAASARPDSLSERRATTMRAFAARELDCPADQIVLSEVLSEPRRECVDPEDPECTRYRTVSRPIPSGDAYRAHGCGGELSFRCDVCGATPDACVPETIVVDCATE